MGVEPVLVEPPLGVKPIHVGRVDQQAELLFSCRPIVDRLNHPAKVLVLVQVFRRQANGVGNLLLIAQIKTKLLEPQDLLLAAQRLRMAAGDQVVVSLHHQSELVLLKRFLLEFAWHRRARDGAHVVADVFERVEVNPLGAICPEPQPHLVLNRVEHRCGLDRGLGQQVRVTGPQVAVVAADQISDALLVIGLRQEGKVARRNPLMRDAKGLGQLGVVLGCADVYFSQDAVVVLEPPFGAIGLGQLVKAAGHDVVHFCRRHGSGQLLVAPLDVSRVELYRAVSARQDHAVAFGGRAVDIGGFHLPLHFIRLLLQFSVLLLQFLDLLESVVAVVARHDQQPSC